MYYGYGLTLSNLKLGIANLTNDAFFINRSVNKSLESSGSILRAAFALYDFGDTFIDFFNHLEPYVIQSPNEKVLFEQNYEDQYYKYDKIIQGIAVDSNSGKLTLSGHYLLIEGEIKYPVDFGYSSEYKWNYSCSHNL